MSLAVRQRKRRHHHYLTKAVILSLNLSHTIFILAGVAVSFPAADASRFGGSVFV